MALVPMGLDRLVWGYRTNSAQQRRHDEAIVTAGRAGCCRPLAEPTRLTQSYPGRAGNFPVVTLSPNLGSYTTGWYWRELVLYRRRRSLRPTKQ
jgi:hypothetical protein